MSNVRVRRAGLSAWIFGVTLSSVLYWGAAALAAPVAPPAPPPVLPSGPDTDDVLHEEWTGGVLRSSYRLGICVRADGQARGVLLLRAPSGKVDVYHVHGERLADGGIVMRHSSGHHLEGVLLDEQRVACKIRLKNGLRLSTTATRNPNARLSADTCRPL